MCDGSQVSRSTYVNLYSVLGTNFGAGNGSTTFNLPNFNGLFPKQGTPGGIGGVDTHLHTLSPNKVFAALTMSAISGGQSIRMWRDPNTIAGWNSNLANVTSLTFSGNTAAETTGTVVQGQSDSTATLPPFLQVSFIIKA
jgi:microcystin-dependent protein